MLNKIVGWLLIAFCFACNADNGLNKPVLIKFNKDSTKIILSNLPTSLIAGLATNIDVASSNLLVVLETPRADDSLTIEKQLDGSLVLMDTNLFFTPEQSFKKGKDYLIQLNLSSKPAHKIDLLKGEIGVKTNRQQQVLSR